MKARLRCGVLLKGRRHSGAHQVEWDRYGMGPLRPLGLWERENAGFVHPEGSGGKVY